MDGYQLVAALVDSLTDLGWPIAVVISLYLFREKLSELLPNLRIRHKDTEVDFRLDQAEQEAKALPPPDHEPEDEPTPEEKSRFERIAEISPRAAMLEVRTDIEDSVRTLAKAASLLTPRIQSTLGLTRLLRSKKVIGHETSALLDDLRVIGNNAAHRADLDYTVEEALRFRALADRAISQLRNKRRSFEG